MVANSLGEIFGQNLRLLCVDENTPAAVAKALNINPVQLHRYIHGKAYPPPAVLKRICDHFGTDARILTEPLPTLLPVGPPPRLPAPVSLDPFRGATDLQLPVLTATAWATPSQTFMPPESILRDGAYLGWTNSLAHPGMATRNIYLVKTVDGVRTTRTIDPLELYPNIRHARKDVASRAPALREVRGIVLNETDGVSILMFCPPPAQWVSLTFLTAVPDPEINALSGIILFGRAEYPDSNRFGRMVWMPLDQGFRPLLQAMRHPVWMEMSAVPEVVRRVLGRPID